MSQLGERRPVAGGLVFFEQFQAVARRRHESLHDRPDRLLVAAHHFPKLVQIVSRIGGRHVGDRPQKLALREWFAQHGVEPVALFLQTVGSRNGNHGQPPRPVLRSGTDRREQLIAGKSAQLNIGQHHIDIGQLIHALLQPITEADPVTGRFQYFAQHGSLRGIVLDNEYRTRSDPRGSLGRDRLRNFGNGDGQHGYRDPENAPLADPTVELQRSSQQLDQTRHDGQPESAALLAGRIGPRKLVEYPFLLFRRNAAPRVAHGEFQP